MLIRSVLFNFQGAFLNSVVLISQTTLLLYHIFSSLSRGFSNFFQSFFKLSCRTFKKRLSFRKLIYYITFSLVCQEVFKTFFKVFWTFLWFFKFSCPHLWRLVYYITFFCESQPFFAIFFDFFRICNIYAQHSTLKQTFTTLCPYPNSVCPFFSF